MSGLGLDEGSAEAVEIKVQRAAEGTVPEAREEVLEGKPMRQTVSSQGFIDQTLASPEVALDAVTLPRIPPRGIERIRVMEDILGVASETADTGAPPQGKPASAEHNAV